MKLALSLNPVLVKEMRGRMRGPRAYLFLTFTLALFGIVSYGMYRLTRFAVDLQSGLPSGAVIGQSLFTGLVFLATFVICAIAPSLTAGAISGEYERKTFDLLVATPLSSSSVLLGKLVAALSYVALVIMAVVPIASIAYVFGGVALADMVQSLLLLLAFAVTFSTLGLFFSALFRRTGLAVGASYFVLAIFVFGTLFVYAVIGVVRRDLPPNWVLGLNPFSAVSSALASPVTAGPMSMGGVFSFAAAIFGGVGFGQTTIASRPVWQLTVGIYAWLTVVLFLATTQLVKPVRRFQPRGRQLLIGGLLFFVAIAAPPIIYGPLTPERVIAWIRWLESSEQNLVANGQFSEALEPKWQTSSYVDRGDEAAGAVRVVSDTQLPFVRFQRDGRSNSVTSLSQNIGQTISRKGWLQLRARVRLTSASPGSCGPQGNACPFTLKLGYESADGARHEWAQGFQLGEVFAPGNPPMCITCENRQTHIPLKEGEWYNYASPNLASSWPLQNVSTLRSITLAVAGESYEVDVADVALMAREGQPLDWSGPGGLFQTPTPAIFKGFAVPRSVIAPIMVPPPPAPTAPPMAVPAPTATPAPTASPQTDSAPGTP